MVFPNSHDVFINMTSHGKYCIIGGGDGVTMQNNRLFRILYYILERGKVTATELAEKFEVSVRTIYRDVDSLSSVGIPIYTTQGKGGGIEIAEDYVLRKSLLTAEEKEQIMAALQGLNSTSQLYQSDLLTKLSALFKSKIQIGLKLILITGKMIKHMKKPFIN